MNPYIFFGFHIFDDQNVAFMCHLSPDGIFNWIIELALKSFFSNQMKCLQVFLIGVYIQCNLFKKKLITRNYYFCLISGR